MEETIGEDDALSLPVSAKIRQNNRKERGKKIPTFLVAFAAYKESERERE